MPVRFLYHAGAGRIAKFFDSYKEMTEFMEEHLKGIATSLKGKWEYVRPSWDRIPDGIGRMLNDMIPSEHKAKLREFRVQYLYYGEPVIHFGKEKPLVIEKQEKDKWKFDMNEIRYWATMPIEVAAEYTTEEGEVKEEGKPYIPPHKDKHSLYGGKLLKSGSDYEPKFSFTEGEPYQHCYANGDVDIVNNPD